MPAWPGGPCPDCGDEMPAKLIRCATCRALLNSELVPKEIEYPDFVPLREVLAVVDVPVVGDFIKCPKCTRELRISCKFRGKRVSCRLCDHPFDLHLGTPACTPEPKAEGKPLPPAPPSVAAAAKKKVIVKKRK